MRQIRYKDFLRALKRFPRLTVEGGKGSEIKIFGRDKQGNHRIHIMGCHGKNPTFSKIKVLMFLDKFDIDPDEFFAG